MKRAFRLDAIGQRHGAIRDDLRKLGGGEFVAFQRSADPPQACGDFFGFPLSLRIS